MADFTLFNTTAPTEGSVALAHQKIIRVKRLGAFENITGDVNNLALNPTPITIPREVYGTKGRQSIDNIGYNFAPTFSVEAVRNPVTQAIAQPWLVNLLNVAYAEGGANRVDVQIFDALDDALPAWEGTFSVAVAEANTGFADKAVYNFTLTNFGVVDRITSPIAGTGVPVIESALPTGAAVGDLVAIRGYKFTGTTGVTIDGVTVLERNLVDDNTLVILVPATVAGSAPIVVTNAAGASASFAYTAA
jgi:IPT/TIG domain